MSRSKSTENRNIIPDAKYGSVVIAKFINMIMWDGKKVVAEKIVYEALLKLEAPLIEKFESVADGFEKLIISIAPTVETKTKRIGGSNYQIPIQVSKARALVIGMKNIIKVSRNGNKGKTIASVLSQEMLLALDEKGEAFKLKINTQKMAAANRAYAHLG